jgi:bla regulator protein BlaR1
MTTDLLAMLLRTALAASAAIVVVLSLRRLVRRRAGAGIAYQTWLLVPVAIVAAALPSITTRAPAVMILAKAFSAPASVAPRQMPLDWSWLVLLIWAAGAGVVAAIFLRAQQRFVRALGALDDQGDFMLAENSANGPALLGLWRPRIVVPSDFTVRYTARQQALIIAHERTHARRRDPFANLFAALLQMLFWFNPLVHIAAARFRLDQEIACDALVIGRFPDHRQAYASALLQTQLGAQPALTTCHWQATHPLKDRMMQLQQPSPSPARRLASCMLLATLLCGATAITLAARADSAAAQPAQYLVALSLKTGGAEAAPKMLARASEPITFRAALAGGVWEWVVTVQPTKGGQVMLSSTVSRDGKIVGKPNVLADLGQPIGVQSGGAGPEAFSLAIKVERTTSAVK